jgi:ribonuclease J
MTFNIKDHKDKLLFIPLGGAKEIGMNLNLYHYNGKWIMADLGAGFADDYYPGIDIILPDISFIKKHILKDLVGIIITHAHEDHSGAVPYLWQELGVPIYTTPFTGSFIKLKLKDTNFAKKVQINIVNPGTKFDLAPFNIEMIPLCHSAPEMQALVIRTELGNILHTGDWKFDHNPLISKTNDEALLKQIGDEGILALVGDSTNVFNKEHSGSEGDLRESLTKIIKQCKKLVVVTTFASNVARIETLIVAAEKAGRKVFLAGRSLHRILEASRNSGYLINIPPFLEEHEFKRSPREKTLVIATGCQGEQHAATTKIASNNHPVIKLSKEDSVIFSSKIIPGNEKKIFRLFNQFAALGAEVYTEQDHFVHVSGHPSKVELKKMYELIRPQIAVPVHGELVHIHEHAKLAREWGVKKSIEIKNGLVAKLAPGDAEIIGEVENGYIGVDGYCLIPINSSIIKTRRKIMTDGLVFVSLIISDNILNGFPKVLAPGLLDQEEDIDIIKLISMEIVESLKSITVPAKKNKNGKRPKPQEQLVDNITRQAVRRIIRAETGKNPVIEVNIEVL